jgi:hypothetical protein
MSAKRLKHSCLIANEEKYFRAKLVQMRETCHGAENCGGFELQRKRSEQGVLYRVIGVTEGKMALRSGK